MLVYVAFPRRIWVGLLTLLSGMWVTLKNFFRRPVTLLYPHQKPELSPAYRSVIELVKFPETGTHNCIACMQCERICPSYCISLSGTRYEGVKGIRADAFTVDYSLCSLCGLCVLVCPTVTLTYSQVYDVAGYRRDGFVYDLLAPLKHEEADYLEKSRLAARAKKEAAKKAKEEAAKEQHTAQQGTSVRGNGPEDGSAAGHSGNSRDDAAAAPASHRKSAIDRQLDDSQPHHEETDA